MSEIKTDINSGETVRKPSVKARILSARLSAVQALYQAMQNDQPIKDAANEFMEDRLEMEIDGEKLVAPDSVALKAILYGVDERFSDLEAVVNGHFQQGKEDANKKIEPLLKAIFLCGTYELITRQDIDAPIIINDYLNVTHAFYEQGEASLVNGVLDSISKIVRGDASQ